MAKPSWLSLGAAVVVLMFGAAASAGQRDTEAVALQRYRLAVQDYATLHRDLARTVPALEISEDAGRIRLAIDALASAIRAARPAAAMGNMFPPDVAGIFRGRIYGSLFDSGYDTDVLLAEINEDCDS